MASATLPLKNLILQRCTRHQVQVTPLRETVLDMVLSHSGVIKAYQILAQLQALSEQAVAPPTAYRALDFWVEQGVLHKVAAVNGYVLCRHSCADCGQPGHSHRHAFILVCTHCGQVNEQTLSQEWAALQASLQRSGFGLDNEHVVLTGVCAQCQQ